jgi:hypothetical protein
MKVKLPAEQEDWLKRPAYIKNNDAGVPICENRLVPLTLSIYCVPVLGVLIWFRIPRLQYLVSKGAILRKGYVQFKFNLFADDQPLLLRLDNGLRPNFGLCLMSFEAMHGNY